MFFLAPLLLVLVAFLYRQVGDIRVFDRAFLAANGTPGIAGTVANQSAQGQGSDKLPSIEEMLPRLEAHLQDNPDDAQGWKLLGTTYLRLQRFDEAQTALSNAYAVTPDDVVVMLQLADVRAVLAKGAIPAESLELIDKALEQEPNNIQGNWLRGLASQQSGDSQRAIEHWQRILPLIKDDAESTAQLEAMIAEARHSTLANSSVTSDAGRASNIKPDDSSKTTDVGGDDSLSVAVTVGEELPNDLDPSTAVFVYAKAVAGPPMPLAVARLQLADLPATVSLDDSMAMVPTVKLSGFNDVVVGARISLTGNPIAQPGDWYAETDDIDLSVIRELAVEINQQVN